ncbi:hypothetical protein BMS_1690 [Halobacteriovorax marinus SJ]|uniref:Uncharacterized protein n=1 Tax=Halobacteriovorax marinus (strain ATCC BAA-682 / DSM 15412 / SJ) TaxID=862908 RepID=E1X1D6_HALMS|nr:hypothetical protein [Halobacteriovorax marinus]CBW26527.1 hypothetical protein BMS_1690 [Halobacteriovorax marinus SJ]
MANRHGSYNEVLSEKFNDKEYAREYLLNLVNEEELSLEDAISEVIKAMSLTKFAKLSGQSISQTSDFISKRQRWSSDKLIKITKKVFDLQVKLTIESSDYKSKAS